MVVFVQEHFDAIIALTVVLIVVLLILCLIAKLFKVAACVFLLSIMIPMLFTVFWGDGTEYVSRIASLFGERRREQIVDAYAYYRDREAEDPLLDQRSVSQYITDFFTDVQDAGQDVLAHFKPDPPPTDTPAEREPVPSPQFPEAWTEDPSGTDPILQPPA